MQSHGVVMQSHGVVMQEPSHAQALLITPPAESPTHSVHIDPRLHQLLGQLWRHAILTLKEFLKLTLVPQQAAHCV